MASFCTHAAAGASVRAVKISSGSGAAQVVVVVDLTAQVVMELPLAMHLVSAEAMLLPVEALAP